MTATLPEPAVLSDAPVAFVGLVMTLANSNATARMRAWRALKHAGAGVLRDGFYLLPQALPNARAIFCAVRDDVLASGGSAHVLSVVADDDVSPERLFDRSQDYAALCEQMAACRSGFHAHSADAAIKAVRKLRKSFEHIASIDFFPAEAKRQAASALVALEHDAARLLSPDEPLAMPNALVRRQVADYQGKLWATRRRPWVDRLACAWLIRRFIDPAARVLWLSAVDDCPADALGFDFDGACFTHTESQVSFEVMIESFGIAAAGLDQIARIVHYLDVGGIEPPDAAGVERVLAGLQSLYADDDDLATVTATVFDGLLHTYQQREEK